MTERIPPTGAVLYDLWKNATKKDGTAYTKEEVGAMFGLRYGQAAGRIWRYEQTLKEEAPPEEDHLFDVVLGEPLRLEGNWTVVSDVQAPTCDLDMVRLVVPASQSFGVKQLLLLGDFINVDWASKYPIIIPGISGTDELAAAEYLIKEWLRWFDKIVWLPGNHEDRFNKLNTGNLRMSALLRMVTDEREKIEVSDFDHCWIDTPQGEWFCAHGTSYSVDQLKYANEMAQKYQAHVIIGHQHHLAYGWDRYKRYMLVDNGGLFDPVKMGYVTVRANKRPNMMRGFTILKDGYASVLGPEPYTNWQQVLETKPAVKAA